MPPETARPATRGSRPVLDDFRGQRKIEATPNPGHEQAQRCLRRQRQVERICRIPRLVFELLDELDRHHGLGADLDRRLERYSSVDPVVLADVGGDRFAPLPLRAVGSGR